MTTYKDAGVDVEAGYKAVALMKEHVKKTFDSNVATDIGSFGGVYRIGGGKVLVSGTDGVGTKLKAAFTLGRHDTVGIDCVAMCANDVVCLGARPLFFLDYIATGKLVPETVADIVKGVSDGCIQAGCALIGGETAEMPGFYQPGEYDIAGFCVGMADEQEIVTGRDIAEGDALVGLASSGVHSNGFSLVRSIVDMEKDVLGKPFGPGRTLGEELLTPTRIYVKSVLSLMGSYPVKGAAHITGGGFIENIPRMFPEGLGARIEIGSWRIPDIFKFLVTKAGLQKEQAFNTFNMGVGMVLAVKEEAAAEVVRAANALGEQAYRIGTVVGGKGVELCG
jgi:phosphoribosylformylglycinamidine cyclo-ligase